MKRTKHFKLRPPRAKLAFIARPHKSVNERGQRTITLQSLPTLYHPFPPFYEQIDELMAFKIIQGVHRSSFLSHSSNCWIFLLHDAQVLHHLSSEFKRISGIAVKCFKIGDFLFIFIFFLQSVVYFTMPKISRKVNFNLMRAHQLCDLIFLSKLTAIWMKGY